MEIAYPKDAGLETSQAPAVQIEDFRGDFAEVASLIQSSWEENGKQSQDFQRAHVDLPASMCIIRRAE